MQQLHQDHDCDVTDASTAAKMLNSAIQQLVASQLATITREPVLVEMSHRSFIAVYQGSPSGAKFNLATNGKERSEQVARDSRAHLYSVRRQQKCIGPKRASPKCAVANQSVKRTYLSAPVVRATCTHSLRSEINLPLSG